jgi:hypothetical protein
MARRALPCLLLLLAQGSAAAAQADPFAAGVRWAAGPAPAAPWMPRDAVFTAGGELLFAAATLTHPHLSLYAAAALDGGPALLFQGPDLPGAIGVVPVAAGAGPRELFAAPQFPAPDALHRRTEVVRYDALAAAAGAPFAPVWTRILPVQENGPALLAADEQGGLVAAIHAPTMGRVHLEWIDAASGAPLVEVELQGGALGALALSAGGERAALTAGLDLWIVNDDGSVAHHATLAAATGCLALAADGKSVVVGGFGSARVLAEQPGGGFAETAVLASAPTHVAARAALAADGASAAVGFWNFATGAEVRVLWLDLAAGSVLADVTWNGPPGLQNYPQELALSDGAERLAVALWGQGGSEPELALLKPGTSTPLAVWNLGGSALALAFSGDGTRLAVCRKSAHANEVALTGDVVLVDTGERLLQLTAPVRLGQSLDLAFLHAGQVGAVFGIGAPALLPLGVRGVQGALLLEPGWPILLFSTGADAAGRADLSVGVPASTALIGVPLAAQGVAIEVEGLVFSELRVELVAL